jgi:hypothetical protein
VTVAGCDSEARIREYEHLRELALGGHESGVWGIQLLLARGMDAWLAARSAAGEARQIREPAPVSSSRLPDPLRQRLVAMLAGMVLGALREGSSCRN